MFSKPLLFAAALLVVAGCSNQTTNDDDLTAPVASSVASSSVSDAPLRNWMRANAATALKSEKFESLDNAFARIETFAPSESGFEQWTAIAEAGRHAAQNKNLESVRAACADCHKTYKPTYKSTLRSRPLNPKG